MTANYNTFAFSKNFIVVENVKRIETGKSIYDMVENVLTAEQMSAPLQIQYILMRYGKSLTENAFYSLCFEDPKNLASLAYDIESYLKELYGDYGSFQTLFGNFPYRVLNMTDIEMAFHTFIHYLSGGKYFPADYEEGFDAEKAEINWSEAVSEDKTYDMIDVTDLNGLADLFVRILSANQSLTSFDSDALESLGEMSYFTEQKHFTEQLRQIICSKLTDLPFKETMCIVIDTLGYQPKTVTDVLRYAVYLSGGDVSLPHIPTRVSNGWSTRAATKEDNRVYNFKKFKRIERRRLLTMLDNILSTPTKFQNGIEEMKKYAARWIRLGEIIHPGESRHSHRRAFAAFQKIRNEIKSIHTWNGKVDMAKQAYNFDETLRLYSQRPGEFARALDSIFRVFAQDYEIVNAFEKVLPKVSMKVLVEIIEHFAHRTERHERTVSPKGSRKVITLSTLEPLNEEFCNHLMDVLMAEFIRRSSEKEGLEGKTFYISKSLEKISIPKNMRSAALGTIQASRGSRIPLPEDSDLLRFYLHWIDENGHEDLDLSATFVDNQGNEQCVGWNSCLHIGNKPWCQFSGDVRCRRGKCAEYIDISIDGCLKNNKKYILLFGSDYQGRGFGCPSWMGFEARQSFGRKGEGTWYPDNIEYGVKITSQCQKILMGIVDLENREFIIADEDINGLPIGTHTNHIDNLIERYTLKTFWNAYKLLQTSLEARGANVIVQYNDKNVNEIKNRFQDDIVRLEKLLKEHPEEIEHLQSTGDDSNDYTSLLNAIEDIQEELNWRKSCSFLTFSDFIKDYTLLLEAMS